MRRRSQRVGTIQRRCTENARDLDRAQPRQRGNDAFGEVVMARPRIGEEDHFERRHWLTGALAE